MDDLGDYVALAFGVAIAGIIVLGAFGQDASWVPNLLGQILHDLFIDAIAAFLAGVVGAIVARTGAAFGIGAGIGAVVAQVLQWVFPYWLT